MRYFIPYLIKLTLIVALGILPFRVKSQNCPSLNVIGSFFDLPTNSAPNYATAQSNGLCYDLTPPYPAQVCFEYMIPFSDTVRATFHLKACGSQSSIGTGTYTAGCSSTSSTNATFTGMSTYDNNCNLIGNYIAVGYCGGAVSGDIMTVCFDLNTSSTCDPITICPMLFCNTSICSTALPIELLSFNTTCLDGKTELNWITSSEINNDYFVIENSTDGINFGEVITKKGAGNSQINISYSVTDDNKYSGTAYYRLKQVDFDGAFSYSSIIAATCISDTKVNIYPNPFNDYIMVDLKTNYSKIILTNAVGQFIKEINLLANQNILKIDLADFPKGIYFIKLIGTDNSILTKKLIKQ